MRMSRKLYAVFNLVGTNREGTSRDEKGTGRDEKLILIMNMKNDMILRLINLV